MKLLLAIAGGGAVGAVARYLVMTSVAGVLGGAFPWGTLAVNIIGSFVLGALVEVMALVWSVGMEMRAFLVVGMLGAFTTFSTFSLDTVTLYERGAYLGLGAYLSASVVLSVGALFAGLAAVRAALS